MKPGDILIVKPTDTDDPEALAHEGQRCRFSQFRESPSGSRFAFVQFSTQGRRVCLREQDLCPPPSGSDSADLPEAQS